MRFHIITNPIVPPIPSIITEAYTQKIFRFCNLFGRKKRHNIVVYGPNGCQKYFDDTCFEFISVNDLSEYNYDFTDSRITTVGYTDIKYDKTRHSYYEGLLSKIYKKYLPNDIIVHFIDGFTEIHFPPPMINVQYGQGCYTSFVSNVVCETYMVKNEILKNPRLDIRNIDVIYPLFDKEHFPELETDINTNTSFRRSNIFLYLARCMIIKGIGIYLAIADSMPDYIFEIAGGCAVYNKEQGILWTGERYTDFLQNYFPEGHRIFNDCGYIAIDLNKFPNVKYLGVANIEDRNRLLRSCSALIQPSCYIEPCGWNVIEAMYCGTPVITSKVGGFLETVIHGKTGFHVGIGEFYKEYCLRVNEIKSEDCTKHAKQFFNEEKTYTEYLSFFNKLIQD